MEMNEKIAMIKAATGEVKADLVLKNASYVNVYTEELLQGDIAIAQGRVVGIGDYDGEAVLDMTGKIVCPGFIDAHIHLESSLVAPAEFVKAVVPHGTTTVIADPHEIANVMGTDGIEYMLQATEGLPVDVKLMMPSCVPATPLDESGAVLTVADIEPFYDRPNVMGLAEMMNAYGVTHTDKDVLAKLVAAQAHNRPIDGHAPGLTGKALNAYVAAGIYSDHECSELDEAMEKIRLGQYIQIREGTAARNLEALAPLIQRGYENRTMFCTDDKHPNDLLEKGHIDYIIKEAIHKYGVDPIIAVKTAGHTAARYFKMTDRGAIAPGYLADMVIIDNFDDFNIEKVLKCGKVVYDAGCVSPVKVPEIAAALEHKALHTFHMAPISKDDLMSEEALGCIGVLPGSIVTKDMGMREAIDLKEDVLKIAVIERHKNTGHIGLGYLQGYGLKQGAVATSISHDSHNIIVVGCSEEDMVFAVNRLLENQGGIVVVNQGQVTGEIMLEIAGLMSNRSLEEINECLEQAKEVAYSQGVNEGVDPFMSLSFMSLPVIPEIKLTTKGIVKVQ